MTMSEQQIDKDIFKLSVSKTKTYLSCALKYKYNYIDHLPKKDFDFNVLGTFLHEVLENFHLHYINGGSKPFNVVMAECYKTSMDNFKDKLSESLKPEGKEILNGYLKLNYDLKKAGKLPNIVAAEKDFSIKIDAGDVLIGLNGCIDRVQIDDDGIVHVADYKSTKNKSYLKNDLFQLLTYAFVLLDDYPDVKKIRASYVLLRHNFEFITKEFQVDEILKIRDKYIQYAQTILSDKLYRPSPSRLCDYCDFLNVCDAGKRFTGKDLKHGEISWT
jgi:putative RecB family exonuclease